MSQKKHILRYLECGYSISGISALDKFGCYRLSSVIFNLRSQGVNIKTRMVKIKMVKSHTLNIILRIRLVTKINFLWNCNEILLGSFI